MFLNTVHHVAIVVSDYDLSRDFYVINCKNKCNIYSNSSSRASLAVLVS